MESSGSMVSGEVVVILALAVLIGLCLVCMCFYFARTTWHAQRQWADLQARVLYAHLSMRPETIAVAEGVMTRSDRQPTRTPRPSELGFVEPNPMDTLDAPVDLVSSG